MFKFHFFYFNIIHKIVLWMVVHNILLISNLVCLLRIKYPNVNKDLTLKSNQNYGFFLFKLRFVTS